MSSMLWKSGAILGVIGVGSAVVFQAQKHLSHSTTEVQLAAEEFDPLKLPDDELDSPELASAGAGASDRDRAGQTELSDSEVDDSENAFGLFPTSARPAAIETEPAENPFGGEPAVASDAAVRAPRDAQPAADDSNLAAPWEQEPVDETLEMVADSTSERPLPRTASSIPLFGKPNGEPSNLPERRSSIPDAISPDFARRSTGLQPLSAGNGGPVLMATPAGQDEFTEEESTVAGSEASLNPFAEFAVNPTVPEDDQEVADNPFGARPGDETGAETDAALRASIPPVENQHTDPEDVAPVSALTSIPQRGAVSSVPGGTAPNVASPNAMRLAAPSIPDLHGAVGTLPPADERSGARVELADSKPYEREFPEAPVDRGVELTAGESSEESTPENQFPSVRSSIPGAPVRASTPPEAAAPNMPAVNGNIASPSLSIPLKNRAGSPSATLPGMSVNPGGVRFPGLEPEPETKAAPSAASKGPDLVGDGIIDHDIPQGPAQPQLTITKQAPKEAVIGQNLEYSILVKNIGRSSAYSVVVEDQIPRGSECTGTAPKCEAENKKLIWRLGELAPGQEQQLRVRVTPTAAGEIGSIATVSFSAEVAAKTTIVAPTAQLRITGPREIVAGQSGQFRLIVGNDSSIDLKEVWVRAKLPDGLNHTGGRDLEYELGDLPRGQSREVPLALQGISAGDWHYDVAITRNDRELARAGSDVSVVDSRLTLSRTGPAKRFVGRPATYSTTVANTSTQPLKGITISEVVPAGLELTRAPQNAQWDPAHRTITWTIPQLPPGASLDFPITVTPRSTGTLEGKISAVDAAGNRAEMDTHLDVAGFSALAVDMQHDGKPIPVGEQISIRFTVKNSGTAAAEQVQAMFELPEEVQFVNAQGPAKFERIGNIITFDAVAGIPAQGDLKYDVVMLATRPTPEGGERIRVSLNSTQVPRDNPLVQQQQIVIFGEDTADSKTVLQTSGTR